MVSRCFSHWSKYHVKVNEKYYLNFWHRSFTFNSNKSQTWCKHFSVYYPDVCLQLNMFRAFSRPSSRAQRLQWQPLVLPSYRGDSRTVFVVGPAGPTMNTAFHFVPACMQSTNLYDIYLMLCVQSWTPDDGRKDRPKHVEWYSINSINCTSSCFYYRNMPYHSIIVHSAKILHTIIWLMSIVKAWQLIWRA